MAYEQNIKAEFEREDIVDGFCEKITAKIITEVTETEDAFIFKTISPWCESRAQRELSKRVLEQAICQYIENPIEWIYSDLLRIKHDTMSIDELIDKVYRLIEKRKRAESEASND